MWYERENDLMLDHPLDMFITELFLLARNDEEADAVFALQEKMEQSALCATHGALENVIFFDGIPFSMNHDIEEVFFVRQEDLYVVADLIDQFLHLNHPRISVVFRHEPINCEIYLKITTHY